MKREEEGAIQSRRGCREREREREREKGGAKTLAAGLGWGLVGDEDPVQRVRGGGGAGAVLRRRGGALHGVRRGGARREQARREAPAGAAALRQRGGRSRPGRAQEASGYFFCLEDRALLCRDCDVSIHTVNSFVSVHQRFLLTGVQVGLDPADPVPPVADKHVNTAGGSVDSATKHLQRNPTVLLSGESSASLPSQNVFNGDYSRQSSVTIARTGPVNWTISNSTIRSIDPPPKYLLEESPALLLADHTNTMAAYSNQISKDSDGAYNLPFTGGNGSDSDWPVDEFFSNSEFGFAEHGSSKGDNAKPGSAGGSPQCHLAEGLFAEGLLGQVPDNPWTVPKVPSPLTASGLYWQNNLLCPSYDSTMFVPEISSLENSQNNFNVSAGLKRRRRQF